MTTTTYRTTVADGNRMGTGSERGAGMKKAAVVSGVSVVALVAALVLGVVAAGAAPTKGCPNDSSNFAAYEIHGTPGDPAPEPGAEPLWDQVVAGAASEGLTIEQLAASLDLDVDGLYNLALEGWLGWDKNGDSVVCVKPFPDHDNGQPDYFANFVDNNAAS